MRDVLRPVSDQYVIARTLSEMFYAAESLRYQFARRCACFRSIPLINIASSSGRIVTLSDPLASGQRKRPRSSRFAQTHNPLPSHTNAFSRVRVRLVNRNR